MVISSARKRPQLVCGAIAKRWDKKDQSRTQGDGTHSSVIPTYVGSPLIFILGDRKRSMNSSFRLDFYGFELVDPTTGEIRRSDEKECLNRFDNLNRSSHNYLRITVSRRKPPSSSIAFLSSVFWNASENSIMNIWSFPFLKRSYARPFSRTPYRTVSVPAKIIGSKHYVAQTNVVWFVSMPETWSNLEWRTRNHLYHRKWNAREQSEIRHIAHHHPSHNTDQLNLPFKTRYSSFCYFSCQGKSQLNTMLS